MIFKIRKQEKIEFEIDTSKKKKTGLDNNLFLGLIGFCIGYYTSNLKMWIGFQAKTIVALINN